MTILGLTLALLAGLPAQAPQTPHCRIEIAASAKGKRCHVQAGHCEARVGGGRYVAWAVGTGPGHCRITKKMTTWDRMVSAKLGKSEGGPSICDLYVALQ